MKTLIKKTESIFHERPGVKGWYYQLPEVEEGRSVIYAEVSGEHGQRVIVEKPRIYFILEGEGEYTVNGVIIPVSAGDLVTVPPESTYNFRSTVGILKIVLFMDLLDLSKLPKN